MNFHLINRYFVDQCICISEYERLIFYTWNEYECYSASVYIVLILMVMCIFVRFVLAFTDFATDLAVLYIGALLNYYASV